MKSFKIAVMCLFGIFGISCVPSVESVEDPVVSVYDIKIKGLDGNEIDLSEFKGKKILIVNVASRCGYTPQYKELQELYDEYAENLVIIGVPCNQFGGQEPGNSEEIAAFCSTTYNVTFPLTEKVKVKGKDQHALYAWLTQKSKNGSTDSSVKWNFQKYLLDEEGRLIGVFSSNVKPFDSKIITALSSK